MAAERSSSTAAHSHKVAALGPAWEHSYILLGRLYLEGPAADLLPYLAAIPELSSALGGDGREVDHEQLAADHHHLFGFNVFPYASVFLDPAGLLGGSVTEAVRDFYQEAGFPLRHEEESPDHLGQELRALAFLSGAAPGVSVDDRQQAAAHRRHLLRRFMDTHLLRWLPVLVLAVRARRMPLYSQIVDLTLELVLAHRAALEEETPEPPQPVDLPEPPDLLSDPGTRLEDIAGYWLTPPFSGLYLARGDLARLARERELPGVFGDRRRMLADLLRAAADYGRLGELLDDMEALVESWQRGYRDLAQASPEGRWLAPLVSPWLARLEASGALLGRLRQAALESSR